MSKHVLVTGFEPFDEYKVNPSEFVARGIDGRVIAGRLVAGRVLPVETRTLSDRLEALLVEHQPEVVIGVGLAAGRSALAIERVGINVLDFRSDNVGVARVDEPIQRGGPEARLSTLPLKGIVEAWHESGVPGYVSNAAGTHLCNQFLYTALGLTVNATPPILVGFVHVPALPAQAIELGPERTPSMAYETMKKGLEVLIETVIPWLEARPAEKTRLPGSPMWIPRGLKEIER